MSVYIKGFVIPENCDKCPVCDYEQGECLVSNGKFVLYEERLKRQPWCPLIPVKDCGDLIDRDALIKEIERVCLPDSLGATIGFGAAKRRIDDAPVVIEGFGKGINIPSKEKVERHE